MILLSTVDSSWNRERSMHIWNWIGEGWSQVKRQVEKIRDFHLLLYSASKLIGYYFLKLNSL